MKLILLLAAGWAFLAITAHVPYQWTHTLSATCYWTAKPGLAHFGRAWPTGAAWAREDRCWAARGAQDPDALPEIKTVLRRWPTQAQLNAWKGDRHENDHPFPAIQ